MNRRQMIGRSLAGALSAAVTNTFAEDIAKCLPDILLSSPLALERIFVGGDAVFRNFQATAASWLDGGTEVRIAPHGRSLKILLTAPKTQVHRVHIRWPVRINEKTLVLGDAWERSYGDLSWQFLQADRILPWYFISKTGANYSVVGVQTRAGSLAFWQLDKDGLSLWLGTRNGRDGVLLADRELELATVVTTVGEDGWSKAEQLCLLMANQKIATHRGRYPVSSIYGRDDWYYAYGKNSEQRILRDAALMRELAPVKGPRPFKIVNEGYQDTHRSPCVSRLSEDIRKQDVVRGIRTRPLKASKDASQSLLLSRSHWRDPSDESAYDPTIPDAQASILSIVRRAAIGVMTSLSMILRLMTC